MEAAAGGVARRFDEAAGQDFRRNFVPRTAARPVGANRFGEDMTGPELFASLTRMLGDRLQKKIEFRGETTFVVLSTDLREVAKFCRDDLTFDYLVDITSVDNFGDEPRFEIVYELYSMTVAVHLR